MLRQTRFAPAGRRDGSLLQKFRGGRPIDDYLDHDEERWLAEFNSYGNGTAAPDMARIRAMRLLIQHQTFVVCEAGRYRARPGPCVGATPPAVLVRQRSDEERQRARSARVLTAAEGADQAAIDAKVPATAAENQFIKIDQAVARLHEANPAAVTKTAIDLLTKIMGAIQSNPTEPKYRKLRKDNKKISSQLLATRGAVRLLSAVGFASTDDGYLVMGEESVDPSLIEHSIATLRAAAAGRSAGAAAATIAAREAYLAKLRAEARETGVPPAQQAAAGSPSAAERERVVEVTLEPTERRRTVLCLPGSASGTAPSTRCAHGVGGMAAGLSVGDTVVVHGLRGNTEANGKQGVVLEFDSREERCVVQLAGQAGPPYAKIWPTNLKLCAVGAIGGAPMASSPPPPVVATPIVEVKSTDCLEEACALRRTCGPDERVAVLNMANAFTPGGGFRHGCGAQEENLHRRSDLHLFLEDERAWQPLNGRRVQFYPIPDGAALYSRDVRVFRGSEAKGYPMLSEPFSIDVVSCPAMSHPALSTATRLAPPAEDDLRIKIRSLLAACKAHGATHIVLSALGCGAFRNPPDHVAELFKEALLPSQLVNGPAGAAGFCFKRCVFSIFDDHNAGRGHNPEGNFLPFHRCFSTGSTPALLAAVPVNDADDDGGASSSGGDAAGLGRPLSAENHPGGRSRHPTQPPQSSPS